MMRGGGDPPPSEVVSPLDTTVLTPYLLDLERCPSGHEHVFQGFGRGYGMGWRGRLGEGVSFLTASSSEHTIGCDAAGAFPIRAH